MDAYTTELIPSAVNDRWTLLVKTADGVVLEYDVKSLTQAKFMAAVFAMGPTTLPPASRIHLPRTQPERGRGKRPPLASVSFEEIEYALESMPG